MENYSKYYRVFEEGTSIMEISTNNFNRSPIKPYRIIWVDNHPIKVYHSLGSQPYYLHPLIPRYHDYVNKIMAIEKAKGSGQFLNEKH